MRETEMVLQAAASSTVSGWAVLGYVVGAFGLAVAILREWRERLDRRRIRPVVIVHEAKRRQLAGNRWVAHVYLTNESAASAFNIRFGIQIGDSRVPWKLNGDDFEASRLNVLAPGERFPEQATVALLIPDEIVFSMKGDPDTGRRYWAHYASPAGERWYTSNPAERSADLVVSRVRWQRWSRWRSDRAAKKATKAGAARIREINEELRSQVLERLTHRNDG